jgi:hypothetical protein
MRHLLFSLVLLTAFVGAVCADSPDPFKCSCEPWDTYEGVFMTPGSQSDIDEVTIVVCNSEGDPIQGSIVTVDISNCVDLCVCVPDDGLTGTTDAAGAVTLNPRVGGCDECTVILRADGVTIGVYTPPGPGLPTVRSTDWDGSNCESVVTGSDFGFFAGAFKETQDPCSDYNGDSAVTGIDFSIFAGSFMAGDSCQ